MYVTVYAHYFQSPLCVVWQIHVYECIPSTYHMLCLSKETVHVYVTHVIRHLLVRAEDNHSGTLLLYH